MIRMDFCEYECTSQKLNEHSQIQQLTTLHTSGKQTRNYFHEKLSNAPIFYDHIS